MAVGGAIDAATLRLDQDDGTSDVFAADLTLQGTLADWDAIADSGGGGTEEPELTEEEQRQKDLEDVLKDFPKGKEIFQREIDGFGLDLDAAQVRQFFEGRQDFIDLAETFVAGRERAGDAGARRRIEVLARAAGLLKVNGEDGPLRFPLMKSLFVKRKGGTFILNGRIFNAGGDVEQFIDVLLAVDR